jgi:hypothetical protein
MIAQVTDQIRQALEAEHGGPVRLVDEQTRRIYYIISAEQFETAQALCAEGEFNPRELYPLISKTVAAAGWEDPAMDAYDSYDEHRHEGQSR